MNYYEEGKSTKAILKDLQKPQHLLMKLQHLCIHALITQYRGHTWVPQFFLCTSNWSRPRTIGQARVSLSTHYLMYDAHTRV